MDVARYKPYSTVELSGLHFQGSKWSNQMRMFDRDDDLDSLDTKLKYGGRYWSAKYVALESHKELKRFHSEKFLETVADDFVLLLEIQTSIIDENVRLDFAEFQDKVVTMQPQKGAPLQTLEKKISILEKATKLNLDNEELLLYLLKAYQSRDNIDILIGRWEKIFLQNSGCYKHWREFLCVV